MAKLRLDSVPAPVLLEGDARVHALQAAAIQPQSANDYVEAIGRLWGKAHSAFIDIGRLLIRAKEMLPHGEYMTAVEERLPFAARTAYQLREAARWAIEMDRRKSIELARLPSSYSTIYLLSTLDAPTLEAAEADGIVRPDLRRSELISWRKRRAAPPIDRRDLHVLRERLLKERARLDEELRRIDAELAR